jgi:hypothetical protein
MSYQVRTDLAAGTRWPSIFDSECPNGFHWCSGPDNEGEPAEFLNGKCDDCFAEFAGHNPFEESISTEKRSTGIAPEVESTDTQ